MFVRYSNPPAFQNTDLTIVEYPDPVLRNRPNDAIEAFGVGRASTTAGALGARG